MAGCAVLVLLPLIIGVGAVMALFFLGLPLYAAFALFMTIACIVARVVLQRRGVFERYAGDQTWRRYAVLCARWGLVALAVFFGVTALIAGFGFWFFFGLQIF